MENSLEIDVRNAKAMGLSYGKYKALFYDPNAAPVPVKKSKEIRCPVCGELVKPPQLKYCSKECMELRNKEISRQRSHERYISKIKQFKDGDGYVNP